MGRACRLCIASVSAVFFLIAPEDLSSQLSSRISVCVAVVNNHSPKSLDPDRMTDRLARSLTGNKIKAVVIDSSTTSDRTLRPTLENGEGAKSRGCDYLVLTQVTDAKADHDPTQFHSTEVSVGGKVPSVDASDPLGGQSGPVYRDSLDVNFALFRPGEPKAVLDTRVLGRPSGNVSDSLMQAMDLIANRVSHELKKKK